MHFQQQKSNALVRKELQAHLLGHQQLLAGYTDYIRRHTNALLQLVLDRPQVCGCNITLDLETLRKATWKLSCILSFPWCWVCVLFGNAVQLWLAAPWLHCRRLRI